MRARIEQVTGLAILVAAAALLGCASVPSTDEYASSLGYQPTQINRKEYFCREPTSPGESLLTRCLTWSEIIQRRYAGTPPVPNFHEDGNANLGIAPQ